MPRITYKPRKSTPEATSDYDLNKNFNSFTGDYTYNKSSDLVLWSSFCEPSSAIVSSHGYSTSITQTISAFPTPGIVTGKQSQKKVHKN